LGMGQAAYPAFQGDGDGGGGRHSENGRVGNMAQGSADDPRDNGGGGGAVRSIGGTGVRPNRRQGDQALLRNAL
jgi:hypothetical protein